MTKTRRLVLSESLWVCGAAMTHARFAGGELKCLRERGMEIVMFDPRDQNGIEELRRRLVKQDKHVIFSWLLPSELNLAHPMVRERKNFSVVVDDWWIQPFELMRNADYVIFRKYHGIAVRLGQRPFLRDDQPPLFLNPSPQVTKYSLTCAAARPLALAASPFMAAWNAWRRRSEEVRPQRYLYWPMAINTSLAVPVKELEPKYDFSNTSGTIGVWYMRDPHAPFHLSFSNLYHDRKMLTDKIAGFEDNPFKFYDCRREKDHFLPYDDYLQKCQQSRFVIASGGLHGTGLVKFLEFMRVAVPMIGRRLDLDFPWLDECMFPVDVMRLPPGGLKPLLQEALDRYPVLKQNCLKWRERLTQLHDFNVLLDMLQEQADGKPIRPGYLRPEVSPATLSNGGV
jgi:hypothetical protein